MLEQLDKQVYFIYKKDIEYLLAAMELLTPYGRNSRIHEVYDADFVEQKKAENPLLFELFANMSKEYATGIMECILDIDTPNFSLEMYFDFLRNLPKEEMLSGFLQEPMEVIQKALRCEQEQISFYQSHREQFTNYFAVEILFSRTEWLIDTYEKFVIELRTKKAEQYLDGYESVVLNWKTRIEEGVKKEGPLHCSEIIMGKTFHNRGPYQNFYFMPAVFLPMKCCRWFEKDQIQIFDAMYPDEKEDIPMSEALKMLSDKTRYKILILLKERNSMSGIEIAECMKLATSTVSHHMTQLKNSGLVHEEPSGTTKYYSINVRGMKNCIETLEKTFL